MTSSFLNQIKNQNLVFKYILIGPSAVGKSCLLYQLTEKQFMKKHDITIGVEFGCLLTTIEGTVVKLQIWDTSGQQSFRSITRSYYRGAQGILLVYDVTRKDSFAYLKSWLEEIDQNADENVTIILVGNKCDLADKRQVSEQEGRAFAEENKILFLEASAKTSINVEQAFLSTSQIIYKKYKEGLVNLDCNDSIKANTFYAEKPKDNKCCAK